MNKGKIAFFASAAVFSNFWLLLWFLHSSGSLMSVSSAIPGLHGMANFGFIDTHAIIPALLTFVVVYMIVHFQEQQEEAV